ncbi:MAG TPA: PIN domain-containing protein [Acidimicrobiales bacterium]|nr:PIN domain-containing protein [Acidimicrobiales bacterium]
MSIVYDAGVLIAAERNDRRVWSDHRIRLEMGVAPITTGPVVAQVSRTGRQVQLRRFLRGCSVVPFAAEQAHAVGSLVGKASGSDIVDAHVVLVASESGSKVLTSDPDDLWRLSSRLPNPVAVRPI